MTQSVTNTWFHETKTMILMNGETGRSYKPSFSIVLFHIDARGVSFMKTQTQVNLPDTWQLKRKKETRDYFTVYSRQCCPCTSVVRVCVSLVYIVKQINSNCCLHSDTFLSSFLSPFFLPFLYFLSVSHCGSEWFWIYGTCCVWKHMLVHVCVWVSDWGGKFSN